MDSTTDRSHRYAKLPLAFGTTLTAHAVTDAPMPPGWLFQINRTGIQGPKTGGHLRVCHTETTTCNYTSAELPALAKQCAVVDEVIFARVSSATGIVFNAEFTITWKKTP